MARCLSIDLNILLHTEGLPGIAGCACTVCARPNERQTDVEYRMVQQFQYFMYTTQHLLSKGPPGAWMMAFS